MHNMYSKYFMNDQSRKSLEEIIVISSFRSLPFVARTDRTAQREAWLPGKEPEEPEKEKSDDSGQFLGDAIEPSRALGCIHPFGTEPIPNTR